MLAGETVWIWEEGMAWPSPRVVEETLSDYQSIVAINPAMVQIEGRLCALGARVWRSEAEAADALIKSHTRKTNYQRLITNRFYEVWKAQEKSLLSLERIEGRLWRRRSKTKGVGDG